MTGKYNVENQHKYFDEMIAKKHRLQHLAGIVQNDWNEFPITQDDIKEFNREVASFVKDIENLSMNISLEWAFGKTL